jgi:hypothetical protein
MTTSVSNTSGDRDATPSRAFNGSVKELTVKPFLVRIKASVSEIVTSSSTTKIWMPFSTDKDYPLGISFLYSSLELTGRFS